MSAQTYDFGSGPVPAHQHKNPDGSVGGWVADTAIVPASVSVGRRARIAGGEIMGGEIMGGEIRGGEIRGGVIRGGVIRGGVIMGGEIRGGEIRGGVIRGGVIRGGVIMGGVIRGGVIRGGVIRGGVIRGGVIKASTDYLVFGPVGSRGDLTTWTRSDGKISTGCFHGPLKDFEARVDATHKSGPHRRNYLALIAYIKAISKAPRAKK